MTEEPNSNRRRGALDDSLLEGLAHSSAVLSGATPDRSREAQVLLGQLRQIAEVQAQMAALQATQISLASEFSRGRERFEARWFAGFEPQASRIINAELATALRTSVGSAERFRHDATLLTESLPKVLGKLAAGELSPMAARLIASEVHLVDRELRPLLDEIVAEEATEVLPGQIKNLIRKRVLELDPDAAWKRAQQVRTDRRVEASADIEPGEGSLIARMPTEQVAACWYALDSHARGARADGDPRTISQIMVDTLVERVTGQTKASDVTAHVNVVMTDHTLFGASDRPAEIIGFGPVPAQIGRLLASSKSAWMRRFFTDPRDDTIATTDTRRRRFDGALRELVLATDQHCRGIACSSPCRDCDHIEDYANGGATSADNGQAPCRRCHHLKDHPAMTTQAVGSTAMTRWRTPIGLVVDKGPPPALGHGSSTFAQLRLRKRCRHGPPRPGPSPLEHTFHRLITHQAA